MHIALCALALYASSTILTHDPFIWNYGLFIFSGTWLVYSLHRIVGIKKVSDLIVDNRFQLIRKYRFHLVVYAIIAAVLCLLNFRVLRYEVKLSLIIPSILSLLYVLPLFLKSKRLRDYNYIKIFLVALCWAWLCGFIPAQVAGIYGLELGLFTAEKALFIFAITLPFDFRDLTIDKTAGVKTLAHMLGDKLLYAISASFVLCILAVIFNPMYDNQWKIILTIAYMILEMITRYSTKQKSDYYFSGIIDGTMIVFFGIVLLGQYLYPYL